VSTQANPANDRRRWAILAVLGVAQLMVVLDATIVNVALPSAQTALHFSTDSRQWVITAYALAFGSLLLVGGKLGDLFGRKWTFVAGLAGFALASALGGFAQSFGELVAARTLQGVFGALLAPSALSLVTLTFADSPDRPKAFGIFSAIAGSGASVGLLLGGALTQALSWRACLYVNLAIAIPTAIAALRLVENVRPARRPRIDVPGTIAGSAGLFALVFGFSNAETHSWGATLTVIAFAASIALLGAFLAIERRSHHPLLPLSIVAHRARGGAYASVALSFAAAFSIFLFLTYFMQRSLGYSPLSTGLAFLPMTAMIAITATFVQTRVLSVTGAKPLVVGGMLLGIAGMLLLTRITPGGSYAAEVLPSLVLVGIGMGSVFAPSLGTATLGVAPHEAGIASAMLNTSQQVGGSVGTALLSTIFASSAASFASSHARVHDVANVAAVHGEATAFAWSAGIFGIGLLVAVLLLPARRRRSRPEPESASTPARAIEHTPTTEPHAVGV
jgi:EmrB/QacA subfamily drug resistance transporter